MKHHGTPSGHINKMEKDADMIFAKLCTLDLLALLFASCMRTNHK